MAGFSGKKNKNDSEWKVLEEDLKGNALSRLYLFWGEEDYLKRLYREKICKHLFPDGDTLNLEILEGKQADAESIRFACDTPPFLAERRLVIVRNSEHFKGANEALADYLKQIPEETLLLFIEEGIDKRMKTTKAAGAAGRIIEFSRLSPEHMQGWVRQRLRAAGKSISAKNLAIFTGRCGEDMQGVANEIEKLIGYSGDRKEISLSDIEAVGTVALTDRVFDMIRAMAGRDQKRALDLYGDLLALKVPPIKIQALIGRQYRQLLLTRQMMAKGASKQEIASALKVRDFAAENLMRLARGYSQPALGKAFRDCVDTEEAVKTGRIDPNLGVELLIISLSRARENPAG